MVELHVYERNNKWGGAVRREGRNTRKKLNQGADEGEKKNKGRWSCESKATCV